MTSVSEDLFSFLLLKSSWLKLYETPVYVSSVQFWKSRRDYHNLHLILFYACLFSPNLIWSLIQNRKHKYKECPRFIFILFYLGKWMHRQLEWTSEIILFWSEYLSALFSSPQVNVEKSFPGKYWWVQGGSNKVNHLLRRVPSSLLYYTWKEPKASEALLQSLRAPSHQLSWAHFIYNCTVCLFYLLLLELIIFAFISLVKVWFIYTSKSNKAWPDRLSLLQHSALVKTAQTKFNQLVAPSLVPRSQHPSAGHCFPWSVSVFLLLVSVLLNACLFGW